MQLFSTIAVPHDALLPESSVLTQGFAGHTLAHYPEPARSYHIAYARLAPYFQRSKQVPLLVLVNGALVGIMNHVWSSQIGIVPVERINHNTLNVPTEIVTLITGDDLLRIIFSVEEVLTELPPWCRRS